MIEIDGSYGEGGGQVLRNSIALSVITNKPVKITNIRENRNTPGVKAQHYTAIHCISDICNAETTGVEIGSTEITFKPNEIKPGSYSFDIGTAGSITLAFQAIMLACINTEKPITVNLTGGTDVHWSPSWDYFKYVFLANLKKIGINVDVKLINRGYYPRGGGQAEITINPYEKIKPLTLDHEFEYSGVSGVIHIANLPDQISMRIKHTAEKSFLKNELNYDLTIDKTTSLSPGVGLTLWTKSNKSVLGTSFLGQKSLLADEVSNKAVIEIEEQINSRSTIDIYAFDQLLPYMVLADNNKKSSCIVKEVTNHAGTNMWLLKQFFDIDFTAAQTEENIKINLN